VTTGALADFQELAPVLASFGIDRIEQV
jgi:hypothetical protein